MRGMQFSERKAAAFRKNIDRLTLKLNEILRADRARSEAGRAPESLKASVGSAYEDAFDFDQMSPHLLHRWPEKSHWARHAGSGSNRRCSSLNRSASLRCTGKRHRAFSLPIR